MSPGDGPLVRYAPGMAAFPPDVLELLDQAEEVHIETRSPRDGTLHRTIIWVVVEGDEVFVRSVRGPRGRWYRELLAEPAAALIVRGRRLPVRAVEGADEGSVERTSAALRDKYGDGPSTRAMLREDTLPTTLRLEPLDDGAA